MEIGLCLAPQQAGNLPDVFDFLEVNVQTFLVPESPEDLFAPNLKAARDSRKPVKAANCFLPGTLRCVGAQVDHERILRYVENAFRRAELVGIEIVVFGSGAARNLPDDVPVDRAMTEFASLLGLLGPIAQHHHLTIALEPLGTAESNFITTLAAGAEVVERCNHPAVRLLADRYHMLRDGGVEEEVVPHSRHLVHVHVAEVIERAPPGRSAEDFRPFFRALRSAGYDGRVSIECQWTDLDTELSESIRYLRAQMAEAGY